MIFLSLLTSNKKRLIILKNIMVIYMNDKKFDLKIKINRARYNLLFMVLMSVINIFFITSSDTILLPYSSAISNYSVVFGVSASRESGNDSVRVLGLIIACVVLFSISVCYVLSKNKPLYLVISLAIIIADTLALVLISAVSSTIGSLFVILDILVHILAIYYILAGIKAFPKLISLNQSNEINTAEQTDNVSDSINYKEEEEEDDDDDDDEIEETDDIDSDNFNEPICEYIDDGSEPLVSGTVNGLNVFIVFSDNSAKMVINGYVCDEIDISLTDEFQLRAIVNDIDFIFDYKRSYNGEAMYLYADENLLDSLGRN